MLNMVIFALMDLTMQYWIFLAILNFRLNILYGKNINYYRLMHTVSRPYVYVLQSIKCGLMCSQTCNHYNLVAGWKVSFCNKICHWLVNAIVLKHCLIDWSIH